MKEKIIAIVFVVVILIFVIVLFADSGIGKSIKNGWKKFKGIFSKKKNSADSHDRRKNGKSANGKKEPEGGEKSEEKQEEKIPFGKSGKGPKPPKAEMAHGPVIYVRYPGKEESIEYRVNKPVYTIGGPDADLYLRYPQVEKKQAEIRRIRDRGELYFVLVNYGKINPTEYFNKELAMEVETRKKNGEDIDESCIRYFDFMNPGDDEELEGTEVFFVGDIKLLIKTKPVGHRKGVTETMIINGEEVRTTKSDQGHPSDTGKASEGKEEHKESTKKDASDGMFSKAGEKRGSKRRTTSSRVMGFDDIDA